MIENQTSNFWYRRISQVATATAILIIAFYLASSGVIDSLQLDSSLEVGMWPAFAAGATLAMTTLTYFWAPKRLQAALAMTIQTLSLVAVAMLIYTTGGGSSPFLIAWVAAVLLTGVFKDSLLPIAATAPLVYAAWLFFFKEASVSELVPIILAGELPVFLSYLLFSHLDTSKEDGTYRQLANEFSQVSGKAEVVINAITNGVIALDKKGTIELINPAAQRLIGWESRDALKLDYKSVLKLTDGKSGELPADQDPIAQSLATNKEVREEDLTLITNSGKKLLISLVASPVGQIGSGILIVFRDVTKEKAEEREQAEFISTASHEMRTPVASIEGYLGLALNPATAQIDEKARDYITKAHGAAQHLGRLFQDLLDVTKAEDGRLSHNPRVVEVVAFLQDVVEALQPQATAKGLIMVYKPIPDDKPDDKSSRRLNPVFYANVDNDHLREVVSNLVENAIKYTPSGTISVDVTGDDKFVNISVQDTGLGIPAEDLPHLFQKFYRVDNTDTREIGGTGLGLYLSRRLVESMNGRIWVESQHRQGSTFHIELERISHQEAMQLIEAIQDGPTVENKSPDIAATPPQTVAQEAPQEPAPMPAIAPQQPQIPAVEQPPQPAPSAPVATTMPPQPIAEPQPNPIAAPLPAIQPVPDSSNDGMITNPAASVIAAQLTAPAHTRATAPSLTMIERNPHQYLREQTNQNIPPENQNQP